MPESASKVPSPETPGQLCWVDLGSSDTSAAAAFYTALFGWTVAEPDRMGYRTCMANGVLVAGIAPVAAPVMPAGWTLFITVSDADATAAKITQSAGSVLFGPKEGSLGIMAMAADPSGAVFAIWQFDRIPVHPPNAPGTLCWGELRTTGAAPPSGFYESVFGWATRPNPTVTYELAEFVLAGVPIAGAIPGPVDAPGAHHSRWVVCFAATDIDAAAATVIRLGGTVMVQPVNIPYGRFCLATDVQGSVFGLVQAGSSAES